MNPRTKGVSSKKSRRGSGKNKLYPKKAKQDSASVSPEPDQFLESLISFFSWSPQWVKESAWTGHMPFASWLMGEIRPKVFVELGTQTGNSYFSFCQAVSEKGLTGRCFAVDTWKGDEHAGFYGEDVFEMVNLHNESQYKSFSTLYRMTFDEALVRFQDRSVELLHIDGMHTYEAVRNDFEAWLPKLAPGALVLFHDIKIRYGDFGVWKLWAELKKQYPRCLEFEHSAGLGILQIGGENKQGKPTWLEPGSKSGDELVKMMEVAGKALIKQNTKANIAPTTEPERRPSSNRPGFWRRLEQSIRKRRKWLQAWIGFDLDWYLNEYPDVARAGIDPFDHFIQFGIQEGRWKSKNDKLRRPNPQKSGGLRGVLFWGLKQKFRKWQWLARDYPRLLALLRLSLRELENTFPFDPWWYQANYPDVESSGMSPFQHFIAHGSKEGRLPNRRFDPDCCLALAPEVMARGIPASLHYLLQGWKEGRLTNWLDKYVDYSFGQSTRERVSNLLDQLLQEDNPADPEAYRKQKIRKLECRLVEALRNRPSMTEEPKVSIIVPAYNQVAHTLACAISLYESEPNSSFELIVADDCSTDETREIFHQIHPGIRVIRTAGTFGFLRNCNHAAKEARGEYLVFLNNDMLLLPEWLDSLVSTIVADPECGMVGSKLLNLDGTLQEAGGIFWNDGSAWNYGRGQNPMAPEFNYKKEVDYCSGASICLRKEVWDAVGGFDEIYAPAYCEESDLAFRLRARGLKTIYQPRSVGIHLEGVTHGTDIANGIKTYQVKNLKKLQDRWSDILKKEHFPNAEQVFLARDRSAKKRHMLFVDHHLPQPDFDAGSKQMATYLKVFVEMGFQITFWPDNLAYDKKYAQPLQDLGIEVISCNPNIITFERWIKGNGAHLDVAFLSRPYVAVKYIKSLKKNSKASIVFYGHDIHSLRTKGELELYTADQAVLARLASDEEVEIECWKKSDVVLYPSDDEKQYILGKFPFLNADILPLYCKTDDEISAAKTTTEFSKRSGILFVGGFDHSPNKDGILWFCNEILPLIRKISQDVFLTIAGSNPPKEIKNLENEFTKVTGHISDDQLSALYESHRVAIAPLRFGGGVKGKVVESMLKGLPMVTTKTGSQGLHGADKALAIAHSKNEICDKVVQLLKNESKWMQQRDFGRRFFAKNFSSKEIKIKLNGILK